MEGEMRTEVGEFTVDLDGRFSSIRTMETNLGNFICDIYGSRNKRRFCTSEFGNTSIRHHSSGRAIYPKRSFANSSEDQSSSAFGSNK